MQVSRLVYDATWRLIGELHDFFQWEETDPLHLRKVTDAYLLLTMYKRTCRRCIIVDRYREVVENELLYRLNLTGVHTSTIYQLVDACNSELDIPGTSGPTIFMLCIAAASLKTPQPWRFTDKYTLFVGNHLRAVMVKRRFTVVDTKALRRDPGNYQVNIRKALGYLNAHRGNLPDTEWEKLAAASLSALGVASIFSYITESPFSNIFTGVKASLTDFMVLPAEVT